MPAQPTPDMPWVNRRHLMQAAGAVVAAAGGGAALVRSAAAQGTAVAAEEHWAKKGPVDLYLYRKRAIGEAGAARPVLFLVRWSNPRRSNARSA